MTRRLARTGGLLRAAAGLLVTGILLAGLPYALARFTGWPLPRHPPTRQQLQVFLVSPMTDDAIVRALACAVWLLWAIFTLSVIIEVVAAMRGQPAPRLPGIAPIQALATALVGATIMTGFPMPQTAPRVTPLQAALTAHAVAAAPPWPGQPVPDASPEHALVPARQPGTVTAVYLAAMEATALRTRVHHVVEGDNLWDIAARYLGNGEYWHQIFALNKDKPQPDGLELTDPDLIYPGWILRLPSLPAGHTDRSGHTARTHVRRHAPAGAPSPSPSPRRSSTRSSPGPSSIATGRRPPAHSRSHPTGSISLPSGVLIGLSLASAMALAVVASRLHRRRRREPYPVPGTAPPDQPLGPALRQARHAHLAASIAQPDDDDLGTADEPGVPPDTGGLPPRDEASTETISVATRDDSNISLDLATAPGIGVTGPGAAGTIRAIMVSVLARRTRDQGEVLLSGDDASRLLESGDGTTAAGTVPGLSVLPAAQDVLSRLEAEIIHRRRLLDAAGTDDLDAYRADDPGEHLPTILVIAPPDGPRARRLAAVLALGQRLGITAVLTGPWPSGATCEVAADGRVTQVSDGLRALEGARMFQLTPADATEMLAALAAANGTQQQADSDQGPRQMLRVLAAPVSVPESRARPVQLAILGPFRLQAAGEAISRGLRRKAAELLAYLAVHPDGVTTDAILEAIWPDTAATRAAVSLHAATANTRKLLREATGAAEASFIVRVADHLKIDQHLVDCDLWQFSAALGSAAAEPDDQARRLALEEAAGLWRGELADGINAVWIEETRETLRRDQVDTLARIAELTEDDEPEHALAALERAINVDRYQETLYRRIMTIQGRLHRPDAARRTYQLLESRLAELDAEPDDSTARLLHQILHNTSA